MRANFVKKTAKKVNKNVFLAIYLLTTLSFLMYNYVMLQKEFLFKKLKAEIKTNVSLRTLHLVLVPYTKKYDFKTEELIQDFIKNENLDVVNDRVINLRSSEFLRKLYCFVVLRNRKSISENQLRKFMNRFFKVEINDEIMHKMHGILLYQLVGFCEYKKEKYNFLSTTDLQEMYLQNQIDFKQFKYIKKLIRITKYD